MGSLRITLPAAAMVLSAAASALAGDLRVPQDYRNLKDALIAAAPGDRVVVTGGRHRNGRIETADVSLVGRGGAQFLGDWSVAAPDVTIEGCTFRDFRITVTADRLTLRGNRMFQPPAVSGIRADGTSGLLIEGNRMVNVEVYARPTTDAVVRGNRLAGGEILFFGFDALVEDNALVRGAALNLYAGKGGILRRNRGEAMGAHGLDGVVVTDNVVGIDQLEVSGDGARVERNRLVRGAHLSVEGDDVTVRENDATTTSDGFRVSGDRAVVTDNVVVCVGASRWSPGAPSFRVQGATASILRNEVTYAGRSAGIELAADDSEFAGNIVRAGGIHDLLAVDGSRNSVHDNRFVRTGAWPSDSSGIVVQGDGNFVANETVSHPGYDGVIVTGNGNTLTNVAVEGAGRCGITLSAGSTSNSIGNCTVDGARWSALLVYGDATIVTGGSYTGGGRVDVLDLGTGTQFGGAAFGTTSQNAALRPYR